MLCQKGLTFLVKLNGHESLLSSGGKLKVVIFVGVPKKWNRPKEGMGTDLSTIIHQYSTNVQTRRRMENENFTPDRNQIRPDEPS